MAKPWNNLFIPSLGVSLLSSSRPSPPLLALTSQYEVDFIIETDPGELYAIEVKGSANPSQKEYKGLFAFAEEFAAQT